MAGASTHYGLNIPAINDGIWDTINKIGINNAQVDTLLYNLSLLVGSGGAGVGVDITSTAYGGSGDGVTGNATAIATAIAELTASSTGQGTISFPAGIYRIESDVTVPKNISLFIAQGAVLSVDSGDTLTINGNIIAGPYQIFQGDGDYSWQGGTGMAYPQWFGATGDGITDDTDAFDQTLDFFADGGTISIPYGRYKVNIEIYKNSITIIGQPGTGSYGTILKPYDLTKPCIRIGDNTNLISNITMFNLHLLGTKNSGDNLSTGLYVTGLNYGYFYAMDIDGFGSHNIYMTSGVRETSYIWFYGLKTSWSRGSNLYMDYGASWNTAVYFVGMCNEAQSAPLSRCITAVGTTVHMAKSYIQCKDLKGVDMSEGARLRCEDVIFDSDSGTDTLINILDNDALDVLGTFTIDGFVKFNNGTSMDMRERGYGQISYNTFMHAPVCRGSLYLIDNEPATTELFDPDPSYRIYRSGTSVYIVGNGHSIRFGSSGDLRGWRFYANDTVSRPTPLGAGHPYFNTDTGMLEVYDGSAWVDVGAGAGGGGGDASEVTYTGTVPGVAYVDDALDSLQTQVTALGSGVTGSELSENMFRDGEFKVTLPNTVGNRLVNWIFAPTGAATIRHWHDMTGYTYVTSFAESTFLSEMNASGGIRISTGADGAGTYFYQDVPAYRIKHRKNPTGVYSIQVNFACQNINAVRIGIVNYVATDSTTITAADEVYSDYNTAATGTLKLENIAPPTDLLYVRVKFYVALNNEIVYFYRASSIAGLLAGVADTEIQPIRFIDNGMSRVVEKLFTNQNISIVAAGDSNLAKGTGSDGTTNTGTSYLHQFASYIKAVVGSTPTVAQYRISNSSGIDLDILYMNQNKISERPDSADPDLVIFTTGRNEGGYGPTGLEALIPSALQGKCMTRFSFLEANIRKLRTQLPEADIIIFLPVNELATSPSPDTHEYYDQLMTRQAELLAQRYGATVIHMNEFWSHIMNFDVLSIPVLYTDSYHISVSGGTYIVACALIEYFCHAMAQNTNNSFKPAVADVRRIAPLTEMSESAWRVNSLYASFLHNDFTVAATVGGNGFTIDGVTEFNGYESSTNGDYIEFSTDFEGLLTIYPLVSNAGGSLNIYVDDVSVGTVSCIDAGYGATWTANVAKKVHYTMTAGTHNVKIKNEQASPVGVWFVGIL